MTIAIADLISELKINAPVGLEIPRDPTTDAESTATMTRWAQDAAQQINERRNKTTLKETFITLVEGQTDYALPSGCRMVDRIDRRHATVQSSEILGIPTQRYSYGLGPFGTLPTGQEISPAIDHINRSRLTITEREDEYSLIGGLIRFLFPIEDGEDVKVVYREIDRDYAEVGDDRFTMLVEYMVFQNIDWYLNKHGVGFAQDHDTFGREATAVLFRRRQELHGKWLANLNAIGPEA